MFDRMIVLHHHGWQQYFYVPSEMSLVDFMDNVKAEITTRKRYNSEIENIKKQLDIEQERMMVNNNSVITAQQGKQLIKNFVKNHPLDNRTVEDILTDSGALELSRYIPPQNFIYDD
jgi:hypothetical protein